jgi:hypothetical protein
MTNARQAKDDEFMLSQRMSLDVETMSFKADSLLVHHKSNVHGVVDDNFMDGPRRNRRKNRRLKTELETAEKQFKCGCGKSYLSYAALYTHTKVKHYGIFPEGTYAGEKRKQGRPKVGQFHLEATQCIDIETRDDSEEEECVQ